MKKKSKVVARARADTVPDVTKGPTLAFPVIGVGASAGGLEAFTEFVTALPPQSGMAFVFILHLPPGHKSLLPEILAPHTDMDVRQISDGLKVEPNTVYVIRPGFTVTITDGVFHLGEPLEKRGHRHPVDDFFRSLAAEQKERAIAVVLSGMGTNGTLGALDIRAQGGLCIAQDPATAKFPSMPESLIKSGHADFILKPAAIPEKLVRYGAHPYVRGTYAVNGDSRQLSALQDILQVLRDHGCPDFAGYKRPTLVRRIERRMGLRQLATMPEYVAVLRDDPEETLALADDLTINVTGFFRDPEVWETLREKVVMPLVAARPSGSTLRAWVSACSSGEESYTVAMLLLEAAEAARKRFDIKIFATDVASRQLASARLGTFPAGIEDAVSPARLERFFERVDSTYRARKELREMIVFAPHNLLSDPPFSRLDLCTCRNLLIYLEPGVQQRLLTLMHFALVKDGVLLLGASETVGASDELFEPIDKKARIYRRIGRTRHDLIDFPVARLTSAVSSETVSGARLPASVAQMTHQSLLFHYGPAALVVDRSQRIVFFHGQTTRFVEQPRGEPTRDLWLLVNDSLRGPLRKAVQQAMSENRTVRTPPVLLEFEGKRTSVSCRVSPLDAKVPPEFFLITFEEVVQTPPVRAQRREIVGGTSRELARELERVREDLQSKIAELQANNEELKASNEEAISLNEELQSTNEELETSKEELQSLNEELASVNAQVQAKMLELETTTGDLASLLSSTNIAVVFLDPEFRIRRFTPAVRDLVELIPQDVGRPLYNLALKFTDEHLQADTKQVLEDRKPISREISSISGRTYVRSVLPYTTARDQVKGVVITFVDITDRLRAERALRESAEQHRLMMESLRDYAIFLVDTDGAIKTWPKAAERMFGYERDEAMGRHLSMIFPPEENPTALADEEMRAARAQGSVSQEGWRQRKDGTRFWGRGVLSAAADEHGQLRGYVKVLRDDTQRRLIEEHLRQAHRKAEEANQAKDQFLATVSHELRTPLSSILLWANLIDEQGPADPEQLRDALGAIKRGAEEQRELIEDLVDTARIASGKLLLVKEPADLIALSRAVTKSIEGMAGEKGLKFICRFEPVGMVEVDPGRVRQVITNLLSNAVKFTPRGGHIGIEIRRQEDEVEIRVTDTGEGFTEEFQRHLFTRFEQASQQSTRAHGGLGIGLSIVKQLVVLHGGTITGESPGPGQGATFVVRMPLPRLGAAPQSSDTSSPLRVKFTSVLRDTRVLVVEDSSETQRALTVVLEEAGARVTAASDAAQALEAFAQEQPDLIVSDVGLPQVNGYEFIGSVRQAERTRGLSPVPALALTAFAGEDTARKALASGFNRCLSKPIEPVQLVMALAALKTSAGGTK